MNIKDAKQKKQSLIGVMTESWSHIKLENVEIFFHKKEDESYELALRMTICHNEEIGWSKSWGGYPLFVVNTYNLLK